MFIREIKKKQRHTGKVYVYHRLTESVRTRKGPRQNLVLNLGCLDLPREQWKGLARRIEEIQGGRKAISDLPSHLEGLAQEFSRRIEVRRAQRKADMRSGPNTRQWESVDLNSVCQEKTRTVGAEAVGYWAFKQLGLPEVLRGLGLSERQVLISALLIIAHLIHPASEQETLRWAQMESALDELLGADFSSMDLGSVYRTCDELVRNREKIEARLADRERRLFDLGESVFLYDLTSTCPSGIADKNRTAEEGSPKHKRSERLRLTLALVLDEDGFPMASKVFAGNLSEPVVLGAILDAVHPLGRPCPHGGKPTVVIDAGAASRPNMALIAGRKWDCLRVSRARPGEVPSGEPVVLRSTPDYTFRGIRMEKDNEVFVHCESRGPAGWEQEAVRGRFQQSFEDGLETIGAALSRKGGVKRYDKVVERLKRLRKRCRAVARFYAVKVEQTEGIATGLTWSSRDEENLSMRFSGGYLIRSSRTDLDETRLWPLYNMLAMVEDNFGHSGQEPGLWPVRRGLDRRTEGRLFISVCACHLLATIHRHLRLAGIDHRWEMIRPRLASQFRSAVSMNNRSGDRITIRQTSEAESFHQEVYSALGMKMKPLPTKIE